MTLTPLAVSALGLLHERPMHPYEMYQLLLERRKDRIVKVRPGSLYHTVERLLADELVVVTGTERDGNRPERTTYAITAAGREAMTERIRELLRDPINEFPVFPVALGDAHDVPEADVLADLQTRLDHLDAWIAEVEQLLADHRADGLPEAYLIAPDYLLTTATAQRDWIRRCVARLESKDLTWPTMP